MNRFFFFERFSERCVPMIPETKAMSTMSQGSLCIAKGCILEQTHWSQGLELTLIIVNSTFRFGRLALVFGRQGNGIRIGCRYESTGPLKGRRP